MKFLVWGIPVLLVGAIGIFFLVHSDSNPVSVPLSVQNLLGSVASTSNFTTSSTSYRGVYVISGNLRSASNNLPDSVYQVPYIDGVIVMGLWNQIEPSAGTYNWTVVDHEINRAVASHKKIVIDVTAGAFAPAWLYQAPYNVPHDTFLWGPHNGQYNGTCSPYVLPAPWDSQYDQAYASMMSVYSAHLKSIPGAYAAVSRVRITGADTLTDELHLAFCTTSNGLQQWQALGYTPDKMIAGGEALMSAVNSAFPDKMLSLSIIQSNDLPYINNAGQIVTPSDPTFVDVKQSLIDYALSSASGFSHRFAVQWNGFQSGGYDAAPAVLAAGKAGAVVGWQTNEFGGQSGSECSNGTGGPNIACTNAGFQDILDSMIKDQGQYAEIFPADLQKFPAAVTEAQQRFAAL